MQTYFSDTLLETFGSIANRIDVKLILMHGALIGWYWNKKLLPWDDDIDLCMRYNDLLRLERAWQMDNAIYDKSKYLIEINPNHKNRTTLNRNHHDCIEPNKIDARFIDKQTGLFLEITALCPTDDGRLSTKCPHVYEVSHIFPLQSSTLEGKEIYVPLNVPHVLTQEYGANVLYNKVFKNYYFSPKFNRWQRIEHLVFEDDSQVEVILSEIPSRIRFKFDVASLRLQNRAKYLMSQRFKYHRIGYDHRPMVFNKNGIVGEGSAQCEMFWNLKESKRRIILQISSKSKTTCLLHECPDSIWRGCWLHHERMAIELSPIGSL